MKCHHLLFISTNFDTGYLLMGPVGRGEGTEIPGVDVNNIKMAFLRSRLKRVHYKRRNGKAAAAAKSVGLGPGAKARGCGDKRHFVRLKDT